MSLRALPALFAFSFAVSLGLTACGGDSTGNGRMDEDVEGSCAKQKPALSATYCRDDQDLWACTEGSPAGKCEPAAASSNSYCCESSAKPDCDAAVAELKQAEAENCPGSSGGITASETRAEIDANCNEALRQSILCDAGCFQNTDCIGEASANALNDCLRRCGF